MSKTQPIRIVIELITKKEEEEKILERGKNFIISIFISISGVISLSHNLCLKGIPSHYMTPPKVIFFFLDSSFNQVEDI